MGLIEYQLLIMFLAMCVIVWEVIKYKRALNGFKRSWMDRYKGKPEHNQKIISEE